MACLQSYVAHRRDVDLSFFEKKREEDWINAELKANDISD
jgi:hypothetical protein